MSTSGPTLPAYWIDPSWGISAPGLSEEKANEVIRILKERGIDFAVTTVDPNRTLTLMLDAASVAVLLAAISDRVDIEYRVYIEGESDAVFDLQNVVADMREFLGDTPPRVEPN